MSFCVGDRCYSGRDQVDFEFVAVSPSNSARGLFLTAAGADVLRSERGFPSMTDFTGRVPRKPVPSRGKRKRAIVLSRLHRVRFDGARLLLCGHASIMFVEGNPDGDFPGPHSRSYAKSFGPTCPARFDDPAQLIGVRRDDFPAVNAPERTPGHSRDCGLHEMHAAIAE